MTSQSQTRDVFMSSNTAQSEADNTTRRALERDCHVGMSDREHALQRALKPDDVYIRWDPYYRTMHHPHRLITYII